MSLFLLSQILVGCAIATDILSFQCKQRRRIVACLFVSAVLVSTHFLLLGHWTAAGLAMVAGGRFAAGFFTTSPGVMTLFIGCALLVTLSTYGGYLSLLSGTAAVCNTVGSFCRCDRRMREIMLAGTSLWLLHNILVLSPMAVALESLFLCSNLVGYYRYYLVPVERSGLSSLQ